MNDTAIKVQSLSKVYHLGKRQESHDTLRDQLAEGAKRLFQRNGRSSARNNELLWALRGVSFQVRHGEVVGIVGHNGAGKSTLLKILSRITCPTEGRVEIYGRLGALLEVGTGFHLELTGRENVYLSGAILGMKKKEIDRKFEEIVDFAEIDQFMDTPVKRYSSGMFVRLAYAVTAHLDPDILLVDEVLSVGDLAFQRKCMAHAKRLQKRSATVLIVSHNMFAIRETCNRALYISKGRVALDGSPEECIQRYESESQLEALRDDQGADSSHSPIRITSMDLCDEEGTPSRTFNHGDRMRVLLNFEISQRMTDPNFVVAFIRSDNVACCNHTSASDGFRIPPVMGKGSIELLTPPLKLVSDSYTIRVLIWDKQFTRLYGNQKGTTFHVRHHLFSTHFGVFHEPAQWSWCDRQPVSAPQQLEHLVSET